MVTILGILVGLLFINQFRLSRKIYKTKNLVYKLHDKSQGKIGEAISKVNTLSAQLEYRKNNLNNHLSSLYEYLGIQHVTKIDKFEGFVKVETPKVEAKKGRGRPKKS